MSDQGTDENAEHDSSENDSSEDGDNVSSSGVELESYESKNIPSEEREVISKADSPEEVDDDLLKEIEEERERRLAPENRPDNVEVDNTKRVFVPAEAKFEDSDIDQDPDLGQEGLAPVGGSDDSDGSDDDSGRSEHVEPDVEDGDPKDDTATQTSGTDDPTETEEGLGSDQAADRDTGASTPGKHKA